MKPPRTSKKLVGVAPKEEKKEKIISAKSSTLKGQPAQIVPKAAKVCQPEPKKKAAGSAGKNRGLQSRKERA